MSELYLVETGFCGEYMVDICLVDRMETAQTQAENLITQYQKFYPNIQFFDDDWSYSSDRGNYGYGTVFIHIRPIETLFEYNTNNTIFLAEHCFPSVIDFELPEHIKNLPAEQHPPKYHKIKEYLAQKSLHPVATPSDHRIFATQSEAKQYLTQFSDDGYFFGRVTPFKKGVPVQNIDNP